MPEVEAAPLPIPSLAANPEIAPHVEGLRRGALVLPRCRDCGFVIWYPRTLCPSCGGLDVEWIEAEGRGTVYSCTTVFRAAGVFEASTPFVIAYVELASGPRILTNIVDARGGVAIGSGVVATYEGEGADPILRFRLAGPSDEEASA